MPERLPADVIAAAIDMYVSDLLGAVAIGKALRIGSTTVYRILNEAKIERRRETRKVGRRGWRIFDDETEKEIATKYASGRSRQSLEAEYGCTGGPIRRSVIRFDGEIRKRGQRSLRLFTSEQISEMRRLWESGISQTEIGRIFDAGQTTISKTLSFHGIVPTSRMPRGSGSSSWVGGRTTNGHGYVGVMVPFDSPYASMRNVGGYVQEHRLVMAQSFGRCLLPTETVHHINGDKGDNRLENLEVRQGKHGKHVAFCCADCGSRNIIPAPLGAT